MLKLGDEYILAESKYTKEKGIVGLKCKVEEFTSRSDFVIIRAENGTIAMINPADELIHL